MKAAILLAAFGAALSVSPLSHATNGPTTCSIQTYDGHYLTAVGGGGHTFDIGDVIHSDAPWFRAWERFTLIDTGVGSPIVYGIRTVNGYYLTAQNAGGLSTNAFRTNETQLRDWEKFILVPVYDYRHGGGGHSGYANGSYYAIQTFNGHYLTAVDGGGRITNVLRSDATTIGPWERFNITCGL